MSSIREEEASKYTEEADHSLWRTETKSPRSSLVAKMRYWTSWPFAGLCRSRTWPYKGWRTLPNTRLPLRKRVSSFSWLFFVSSVCAATEWHKYLSWGDVASHETDVSGCLGRTDDQTLVVRFSHASRALGNSESLSICRPLCCITVFVQVVTCQVELNTQSSRTAAWLSAMPRSRLIG